MLPTSRILTRFFLFLFLFTVVMACCIINPKRWGEKPTYSYTKELDQKEWLEKTQYAGIVCFDSAGNPYVCNELIVNLKNYKGDLDSLKLALGVIDTEQCYSCVETDVQLWKFDPSKLPDGDIENGKTASVKGGGVEEVEKNYIGANLRTYFGDATFSTTMGKNVEDCEATDALSQQLEELFVQNPNQVNEFYQTILRNPNFDEVKENVIGQLQELGINNDLISQLFPGQAQTPTRCFQEHFLTYKGIPRQNGLIIGIIDSGFDYDYPFDNSFPKGGFNLLSAKCTGVSYDFVENDEFPNDDHGHGTHVAGIIIKELSNMPINYQILPIKSHDKDGASTMFANLCAVNAAILNDVDIVNMSFGWQKVESELFKDAMRKLDNAGIVVVTSAGNGYNDNDIVHHYPSDYNFKNIISVAAYDKDRKTLVGISNFGKQEVDIAAKGINIKSIVPTTTSRPVQMTKTGTSMAAPLVVSRLVMSKYCYRKTSDPNFQFSTMSPLPTSIDSINNHLIDSIAQGRILKIQEICP